MCEEKTPLHSSSLKRLLRHTAIVPKGFLRFYVLRLLRERPMSGSEIMDEIERETDGIWKPSPGSIYPLLAWLRDNGYAEELPSEEGGIKRYKLTERGKKFLQEQIKHRGNIFKKIESFIPPLFLMGLVFRPYDEELTKLREAGRRFAKAFLSLRRRLMEKTEKQTIEKFAEILDHAAEKMEELSDRLKGEGVKGEDCS
ncbi:MAG: helix-turn-helix transcriptional regulator [Candidatus Asgardarchaeia archaeon]